MSCVIRFILLLLLIGCSSIRLDPEIIHQMSLIEIQEVQSIQEAKLYQRLSNILNTGPDPLYLLQFQIQYHQDDIGISKKFDVIRKGIINAKIKANAGNNGGAPNTNVGVAPPPGFVPDNN